MILISGRELNFKTQLRITEDMEDHEALQDQHVYPASTNHKHTQAETNAFTSRPLIPHLPSADP